MEIKEANSIGSDSYCIRLKDKPNYFLHPSESGYVVNEGKVGAAIWHKEIALRFIKLYKLQNVEMVAVKEILKTDNSYN